MYGKRFMWTQAIPGVGNRGLVRELDSQAEPQVKIRIMIKGLNVLKQNVMWNGE